MEHRIIKRTAADDERMRRKTGHEIAMETN